MLTKRVPAHDRRETLINKRGLIKIKQTSILIFPYLQYFIEFDNKLYNIYSNLSTEDIQQILKIKQS